ncbi:hypothetical protein Ga0100231_020955 [Opitutaceae bacterium TAV4]|nr:hypothetical protein Ga0100231_020955 [Opitutaceae bacterium TAV4]RRK00500.1 hypothetical protein Ga0100230_021795 [Opitutaceae bacterium TAV3]
MSTSASFSSQASPEFCAAFRRRASAGGGGGAGAVTLTFADFMEVALYDPGVGYYRAARQRVGRASGTDFYTATSSGALFGELVCAAAESLVQRHGAQHGVKLSDFAFVEIGAEPGGGILRDVATHPFRSVRTLGVGDLLDLNDADGSTETGGPCVVFSNELFDAQPVRRFVRHAGAWHELGVTLMPDGTLHETRLASVPPSAAPWLPAADPANDIAPADGDLFDAPRAAAELAARIAAQPWSGLFIAFDYGKTWRELATEHPAGTARAYRAHRQHNDLLADPGGQDLTAHVCWDWLADALRAAVPPFDAGTVAVESQEAFFIHHAVAFLEKTFVANAAESSGFSPRKSALMQLLHPANMGQKFQVLHAWRAPA